MPDAVTLLREVAASEPPGSVVRALAVHQLAGLEGGRGARAELEAALAAAGDDPAQDDLLHRVRSALR